MSMEQMSAVGAEYVVLLDEEGAAAGIASKADVHHQATPLHLAFSCYVFNAARELLVTQRAASKSTWPGVWTNSCCGHPAPDEELGDAVRRRLDQELGLTAEHSTLVLPRFRYCAEMENGMRENEMCPVFCALVVGQPRLDPSEVDDCRWVPWQRFASDVLAGTERVSPWCEQQVAELAALGPDPLRWPLADARELPAASRSFQ
jgi:isopentenyl-diphosphate delta-isomerase